MKRSDIINYAMTLEGETGHCEVLNIYNSQKDLPRNYAVRLNDDCCATFVSAIFLKYGWSSISECSCQKMIDKAKKITRWCDASYKAGKGDIIMYDWGNNGSVDHVGIICDVTDAAYIVREVNKNKTIGNRTIMKNDKTIEGFIIPPYEEESHKDKLLDKISEEIATIAINGQIDKHTMFIRTGEQVKQMALEIIDKYKAED